MKELKLKFKESLEKMRVGKNNIRENQYNGILKLKKEIEVLDYEISDIKKMYFETLDQGLIKKIEEKEIKKIEIIKRKNIMEEALNNFSEDIKVKVDYKNEIENIFSKAMEAEKKYIEALEKAKKLEYQLINSTKEAYNELGVITCDYNVISKEDRAIVNETIVKLRSSTLAFKNDKERENIYPNVYDVVFVQDRIPMLPQEHDIVLWEKMKRAEQTEQAVVKVPEAEWIS